MSNKSPKDQPSILGRILTRISGKPTDESQHPSLGNAYTGLAKVRELMAEKARLEGLCRTEAEKKEELTLRLDGLERRRHEMLAQARIEDNPVLTHEAGELRKETTEVSLQIGDADGIINAIQGKIGELGPQMDLAIKDYKVNLANCLDEIFSRLAVQYHKAAPEVAELALQAAAVQNVMMQYLLGNSNGFERRIYLPNIVPGEGRSITPLLDADSADFSRKVSERMSTIVAELREAGFVWKF